MRCGRRENDIIDLLCMSSDVSNLCSPKFWPQTMFVFRLTSLFMVVESLIYKKEFEKGSKKSLSR